MRSKVDEVVSKFIRELRARHPRVTVELLDWRSPWVDASVRIKCPSEDEIDEVMETEAHLTTKYYLDEGVYIQVFDPYTSPPPSSVSGG